MTDLTFNPELLQQLEALPSNQFQELMKALGVNRTVEAVKAHTGNITPTTLMLPLGARVVFYAVDLIAGFTQQGALADPQSMIPAVTAACALLDQLIQWHKAGKIELLIVNEGDDHQPWQIVNGMVEGYPVHCMVGTDETKTDPLLQMTYDLAHNAGIRIVDVPKLGIDSVVSSMERVYLDTATGEHVWKARILSEIARFAPTHIVGVGDCTDICMLVMRNLASAATAGLFSPANNPALVNPLVTIFTPGVATYNAPAINHPGALFHAMGIIILAQNQVAPVSSVVLEGNS